MSTNEQNSAEGFSMDEWANTRREAFNLTDAFRAEVEPMLDQLKAKCAELGMPMFAAVAHCQDVKEGSTIVSTGYFHSAGRARLRILRAYLSYEGDMGGIMSLHRAAQQREALCEETTQ